MRSENRDKHAVRRFLRRLIDHTGQKFAPHVYRQAPCLQEVDSLDHRSESTTSPQSVSEQLYRGESSTYQATLGFDRFESASRFCDSFHELRNYLRVQSVDGEHVPVGVRRKIYT
jgi:hypothetical protein